MLGRAEKAKDPARKLMNDVIDLLFTKEELARSGGMGDREKRGEDGKQGSRYVARLRYTYTFFSIWTHKNQKYMTFV